MNIKKMKLPIIILAIGIIAAVAACLLTGILREPVIKEHDFAYSVTYKLNGEEKTAEGVFRCTFDGSESHNDPMVRSYVGAYMQNGEVLDYGAFTIAEKDGVELSIITALDAAYLMGDPDPYEYDSGNESPYLEAVNSEGVGVEVSELFDAEIVSWEYPEPIDNSFRFVGFSILHTWSMLAMTLVGILTILACVIFVKKDAEVSYKVIDVISIVANFVIGFVAIPVTVFLVWIFQLVMSVDGLLYQAFLCLPAVTAFTIAVSIVLRRKGFGIAALIVPFVPTVLFFVPLFFEVLVSG